MVLVECKNVVEGKKESDQYIILRPHRHKSIEDDSCNVKIEMGSFKNTKEKPF